MKTKKIYMIAALLGTLLTGCQKEVEIQTPAEEKPTEGTFKLTLVASKSHETKALDLTGNALTAYWKSNEIVSLYKNDSVEPELLEVEPGDGELPTSATLSGEVTGLAAGDKVLLLIPTLDSYRTCNYTGQKGTIADIEANYDFAAATVTMAEPEGNTISASAADFDNLQSIYRLGFREGSKDGDAINVKGFTVSSANNALVRSTSVSWDSADGGGFVWTDTHGSISVNVDGDAQAVIYAALRNTTNAMATVPENDTYSFDVIDEDDILHFGTKVIPIDALQAQYFLSAQKIVVNKTTIAQQSTSISSGVL